MKRIILFIAIFYASGILAQSVVPYSVKEPARGSVVVYPSEGADSLGVAQTKYLTPLVEWKTEGGSLSTTFTMPFAWANRQVLFHVGSASADYTLLVNGREVSYNSNGNVATDFNITKFTKEGRNAITVRVDADPTLAKIESWKGKSTAISIAKTYVMSQPTIRIRDIFVKTRTSGDKMNAEVGIVVKTSSLNAKTARIYYELIAPDTTLVTQGSPYITLKMRGEDTLRFVEIIPQKFKWSVDSPKMYTLKLKTQIAGRYVEFMSFKLGFRTVEVSEHGDMSINGEVVELHVAEVDGVASAQDLLKLKESGYNTIKIKPSVIDSDIYRSCDTMGMYVIAPTPIDSSMSGEAIAVGGNLTNDPKLGDEYISRAESSYHTTKRHPSVIAFSLADNSANGVNLYESYLRMKDKDDSRPMIYLNVDGEWNSDRLKLNFSPKQL